MRSKLLSSLVAGSLVLSPSVAIAQTSDSSYDATMEDDGDDDAETATAVIFGLIVFAIAVWVGRDNGDDEDIGTPVSP